MTDRFEDGIIFSLDLSGRSMVGLGDVGGCENLVVLNLSKNNLRSLDGIQGLNKLLFVNVSFNAIRELSPLSACLALVRVEALSNDVSEFGGLKALGCVQSLKSLNLQNLKKEETNPVCKLDSYRQEALKCMPHLSRLDYLPRLIDIQKPQIEEPEELDLAGFLVTKSELYGDFDELERRLSDGKKLDSKIDLMMQSMQESQAACKKKQDRSEELIRDLNNLLK